MVKFSFFNVHVAIYETQQNCTKYVLIYLLLCILLIQDPDIVFRIIQLRRLFTRFCFADEDALFMQKP